MWHKYVRKYDLKADVMSMAKPIDVDNARYYRLIIVDESLNLRNPQGRRYHNMKDLIQKQDSKVLLLTATPYNKDFTDLGAQLRLFLGEDLDLGIRPEEYIRALGGERAFMQKHSEFPTAEGDQFSRLYSDDMIALMEELQLPRYGLSKYLSEAQTADAPLQDKQVFENLSRAGARMMGFCKSTFFKRMDSSGFAFLMTLYRHIVRNAVFIYAIENKLDLPIGDENPMYGQPWWIASLRNQMVRTSLKVSRPVCSLPPTFSQKDRTCRMPMSSSTSTCRGPSSVSSSVPVVSIVLVRRPTISTAIRSSRLKASKESFP